MCTTTKISKKEQIILNHVLARYKRCSCHHCNRYNHQLQKNQDLRAICELNFRNALSFSATVARLSSKNVTPVQSSEELPLYTPHNDAEPPSYMSFTLTDSTPAPEYRHCHSSKCALCSPPDTTAQFLSQLREKVLKEAEQKKMKAQYKQELGVMAYAGYRVRTAVKNWYY